MTLGPLAITGAAATLPDVREDGAIRVSPRAMPARFDPTLLRRTSRLSRLALPAIEAALARAGRSEDNTLGLVVGTGLADLAETSAFLEGVHGRGEAFSSPQQFQRSVHGVVAGEIAILYGLSGYNATVTQGLESGEAALFLAALAVQSGSCARCLCVAVDAVSSSLLDGLRALGIDGEPGEGAAAIILERIDACRNEPLATLESIDIAEAGHAPDTALLELGWHGAMGLLRTVLALDAKSNVSPPRGVRLGAPS